MARRVKPLIVGEAPGRRGGEPIAGAVGRRLAAWSGLSFEDFARAFDRVNVLDAWPGSAGKGSKFTLDVARSRAVAVRRRFTRGRVVVMLGQRVPRAFNVMASYFDPIAVGGARVFVVPHPSGINRWYNDADNVATMAAFMRRLVAEDRHA